MGRAKTNPRPSETAIVKVVGKVRNLDERIALRCGELGITYAELAGRLGYAGPHATRVTRIMTSPTIKYAKLVRLARALEWDSLAPFFARIPTFEGETKRARAKMQRNLAASVASAIGAEPAERGRK